MNVRSPALPTVLAFLPSLLLGLFMLSLLALARPAHAQPEISAIPASFSKGARIKVSASGLATSGNYRLRLEEARPGTAEFDLADFSSGASSSAIVPATIPSAAAGNYDIVLYRVQIGLVQQASTPVSVTLAPAVTLTPSQGAPGRKIAVVVSNLKTGMLRVNYAGSTILGPVAVGTSYSGAFLVPGDRPSPLPATVPIVVENLVGRLVVGRTTLNFQALAPSGLPQLGFQQPQIPTGQIAPRSNFIVAGTLSDSYGQPPSGLQNLYFIGGGLTVPMDAASTLGGDGALQLMARAPDAYFDGISAYADRPGELVLVNQGIDANSGARRNGQYLSTGNPLTALLDGRDAGSTTFTIVVRGYQPGGGPLLQGAIVEAEADYQAAFYGLTGHTAVPATTTLAEHVDGHQLYQSSMANQFADFHVFNQPPRQSNTYGCPTTFFRKTTNAQGRALFTVNPDDIADVNAAGYAELFSCQPAPCRPDSVSPEGDFDPLTTFIMNIYATHLGYRNYSIAVGYDGDTGQFFNVTDGTPFVGNSTEVVLEPSEDSDFDLRHLRIDGVGGPVQHVPPGGQNGCPPDSGGVCYDNPIPFRTMYTYPSSAKWPNSVFQGDFNVGRKARLEIDTTVYGPVTFGRIRIGNTAWANFSASGSTPVCVLDATTEVGQGKVEYVASLPDLTRLPTGVVGGTVELSFGGQPTRSFALQLTTAAPGVDVLNPNIRTLEINALIDKMSGTYNVDSPGIPVGPPGHGVGRLDSVSVNDGTFTLQRFADGNGLRDLDSTSNNDVAANPGGPKMVGGTYFGFTNSAHNEADPVTLFDTGIIPLFRYTWGLPPIAGATLGADFWMGSTLAFYGELLSPGMNATIDPRLAGGVNLNFDLSILVGLVSGSIGADSELGIAMRSRINDGGFAHLPDNPSPPAGRCFTFDLDGVWEVCAVGICDGGRENLLAVREPHGCANSVADDVPLYLRRNIGLDAADDPQSQTNFDLPRPRYTATAIGGDDRGHAVTIGVRDNGDLIATHVTGGIVEATRLIARNTVAAQDVDVAFYATNRAMAVWSENTRSEAEIIDLLHSQGGRAFDDIARTQRLRFAYWDGHVWSTPANLTSAGSDGRPQLAGCLPSPRVLFSDCPTLGEITAVWEHDRNQNLDAPDLEVWSSTWRPDLHSWTSAQRVSATGVSSDMLPSVAYRKGVPIVAWARNPGGAFVDLNQRHVAYRILDGSAQVNATDLGNAVGWVDIGVSAADGVVIAYTRAQDPEGFVGNRQALFGARASSCANGTCSFLVTEVRDPNDRQIRVEHPRVTFDETDTPIIAFRGLAFGPDAQGHHALPGDLPGFLLGTGELAMVRVHSFAHALYTAQVVGLSDNGLQHWKPDVSFDETMGGLMAVSMQAEAPAGLRTPIELAHRYSPQGLSVAPAASDLGDGAMLRIAMAGPDFEIRNAHVSRTVVAAGQIVGLDVDLINVGSPYVPATHGPVNVILSLNGPAGSAVELGHYTLSSSATTNDSRLISFIFNAPASVVNDELQTLFIDIVAGDDSNANDGSADHARIEVNAMPVPTHLNAAVRPDMNPVNLTWADPNDTRVYGWRVWRLDDAGHWQHLGSTRVPGYVDITAPFGVAMTYRVAAYSANGMESEPSESISTTLPATPVENDVIFANSFELPSP
ncbi:MAG: hypothetical protein R3F08_17515 [Dokdonella sp.]|nr:hypothetical protein [Dokdonella sp.]MCB1574348.1 hypothetical protein [Xanthomonadales bacterium]MCB1575892.1 hypothetical protein [Xanthomonadales bacterium]